VVPYIPTDAANLIAWYRFDTNDTGALVADASGNGNYMQQTTTNNRPVVANGYGTFSGTNWLNSATTNLLTGATQFMVAAWIYVNTYVEYSGIIWQRGVTADGLILDDDATPRIWFQSYSTASKGGTITTGAWIHAAGAWQKGTLASGAGMWVFLNGVPVSSNQQAVNSMNVTDF
jgi:hypothetical protein